ncbi:MAG: hypothetical protein V5A34_07325 [Halapricum sp.]
MSGWKDEAEIDWTDYSDTGSDSWGWSFGGDKTGQSASTGDPAIAEATAFADISGYGGNTHWASIGSTFKIPGSLNDERMSSVQPDADIQGEVWGVGAVGKLTVELVVDNLSKDIERSEQLKKYYHDKAWAQEFDDSIDGSIDINLYPGDTYRAKLVLETKAKIQTLVGGVGSADCGPFDGDDRNRGLRLGGFTLDIKDY